MSVDGTTLNCLRFIFFIFLRDSYGNVVWKNLEKLKFKRRFYLRSHQLRIIKVFLEAPYDIICALHISTEKNEIVSQLYPSLFFPPCGGSLEEKLLLMY